MYIAVGLKNGTEIQSDIISDEQIIKEVIESGRPLASGLCAAGAPEYVMNPQTVDDVYEAMKYTMGLAFNTDWTITDFALMVNGNERHILISEIYWYEVRR